MTVVALTGFLSHAAYRPDLGRNALVSPDLPLPAFFPGGPSWLYALNQGLHVNVGLVVIPVVLAKLWSVIPRLFVWPPAATPAQALERASAGLLVASTGFQLATGVVNIQYWYVFDFNFVAAHYYGGVVFVAAFLLHLALKLPVAVRAYRSRGVLAPLRQDLAHTAPGAARRPARGRAAGPADDLPPRAAAAVGGGSLALAVANAGESIGGPLRATRSWRRGGRAASRSTRRPAARASARRWSDDGYRLVVRGGDARARPLARGAARPAAGDPRAHAGVRRGLVDAPDVDRRAARRARAPGRGRRSRASCSWSRSSPQGILRQATLSRGQVARRALAARAAGRRRGPVARPRLPGADHRPGPARRAQHQVGGDAHVPVMRARYGASPLHLLAHLTAFALAGWALLGIVGLGGWPRILLWLAARSILHDALLWPGYTLLDRLGGVRARSAGRTTCASRPGSRRCSRSCSSPSCAARGADLRARERSGLGGLRGPLAAGERGAVRRLRRALPACARGPGRAAEARRRPCP